ncbi:hypothetical protein BT63DRAFT_424800 [Microthyrium microscopicum]|uniref:Nudix hydrolase domain-containing protein n=1 Tax=Microthyrium microscopicum TaxID=703497 RepID=A0A6A6UAV9_9PEZI|nr:hypothetical protein BT63DRAFT_424800 [Microthyrium microscopicum]
MSQLIHTINIQTLLQYTELPSPTTRQRVMPLRPAILPKPSSLRLTNPPPYNLHSFISSTRYITIGSPAPTTTPHIPPRRTTTSRTMSIYTAPKKRTPAQPRPSASVLLISPTNQILLLHRVRTSTSFASAHVFPGGNVSEAHDGRVPEPDHKERHVDSEVYRMAAIRETFEESGILLAHDKEGKLLGVGEKEREAGRKEIHSGKVTFPEWLKKQGGVPDTGSLIPFTRWITPPQVPKRYTTQMYVYFLPMSVPTNYKESTTDITTLPIDGEAVIPTPTHDGGVEHTAARFAAPSAWLEMANEGKVILYPPQYFLLTMISKYLKPTWDAYSTIEMKRQRRLLEFFLKGGDPPWTEACISPVTIGGATKDGRALLSLEKPGKEVEHLGRRGVKDYVVLLGRGKDGNPSNVEVKSRNEVADIMNKKANL